MPQWFLPSQFAFPQGTCSQPQPTTLWLSHGEALAFNDDFAAGMRFCAAAFFTERRIAPVDSMKLLVNAVPLHTAGGRTVGLNVLRMVRRLRPSAEIVALVPADVGYEQVCADERIECRPYKRRRWHSFWRLWFDSNGIRRLVRETGSDALFTMGNLGPRNAGVPHVVLFHNPYYIYPPAELKRFLAPRERISVWAQRKLFAHSLAGIDAIAPQTTTAATRLSEQYGVTAERIAIIPNAMTLEHVQGPVADSSQAQMIGEKGSGRIKLLTLSRYYPHKNIEFVIDVARALRAAGDERFAFFITVDAGQHPGASSVLAEIVRCGLSDMVINLGAIPLAALPSVYTAAQALFFPTRLESFSGTYLEAMHYGLPIATSNLDFAVECCGDAALYFDPGDVGGAVAALDIIASHSEVRDRLREAGKRKLAAQLVSWETVTECYMELVEEVIRRRASAKQDAPAG